MTHKIHKIEMHPDRFIEVGRTVGTPAAIAFCEKHGLHMHLLLARHQHGDWGDLDEHDLQVNKDALKHGARIMSVYKHDAGSVWIITEADRSVTTVLLPEDY